LEKLKSVANWKKKSEIMKLNWADGNESLLYYLTGDNKLCLFDVRTGDE